MAVLGAPESYHGNAVMRRKHFCSCAPIGHLIVGCLTIDVAAAVDDVDVDPELGVVPPRLCETWRTTPGFGLTGGFVPPVAAVSAGFFDFLSSLFGAR